MLDDGVACRRRLATCESTSSRALEEMDLSHNGLTGTFPSVYGTLTRLVSLRLDRNLLTGSLPESLSCLTRLT